MVILSFSFPQKVWNSRGCYVVPGLKKKVLNKIFLHTTHNYLHTAEYDENQKHKRTQQINAIPKGAGLPGDTAHDSPGTTTGFAYPQTAKQSSQEWQHSSMPFWSPQCPALLVRPLFSFSRVLTRSDLPPSPKGIPPSSMSLANTLSNTSSSNHCIYN